MHCQIENILYRWTDRETVDIGIDHSVCMAMSNSFVYTQRDGRSAHLRHKTK